MPTFVITASVYVDDVYSPASAAAAVERTNQRARRRARVDGEGPVEIRLPDDSDHKWEVVGPGTHMLDKPTLATLANQVMQPLQDYTLEEYANRDVVARRLAALVMEANEVQTTPASLPPSQTNGIAEIIRGQLAVADMFSTAIQRDPVTEEYANGFIRAIETIAPSIGELFKQADRLFNKEEFLRACGVKGDDDAQS